MCNVSIVMAAFNAESFIDEAVRSVLEQTYPSWELIIVDDCSSDGTSAKVQERYGHLPNIRCHRLARNAGPSAARNAGIALAAGKWIAVLDSDDRYLPDRLEKIIAAGERDSLDLMADNQWYLDGMQQKMFQTAFRLPQESVPLDTELLLRNDGPPLRFSFGALKPIVRKQFLQDRALEYPEDLRIGEDFAFLFRCLAEGANARLFGTPHYVYTVPKIRARAASDKTRTNYGTGNLEALIATNTELLRQIEARAAAPQLAKLLRLRRRRLICALMLRDRNLQPHLWLKQGGWSRYLADKARNLFQRSHVVRGVNQDADPRRRN